MERLFYSDGEIKGFKSGRYFFAGCSLDDLLLKSLRRFAEIQVELGKDIPYDHRFLRAFDTNSLTEGLIKRYLRCREIEHIDLVLTPDGKLDAEVIWFFNPQA